MINLFSDYPEAINLFSLPPDINRHISQFAWGMWIQCEDCDLYRSSCWFQLDEEPTLCFECAYNIDIMWNEYLIKKFENEHKWTPYDELKYKYHISLPWSIRKMSLYFMEDMYGVGLLNYISSILRFSLTNDVPDGLIPWKELMDIRGWLGKLYGVEVYLRSECVEMDEDNLRIALPCLDYEPDNAMFWFQRTFSAGRYWTPRK